VSLTDPSSYLDTPEQALEAARSAWLAWAKGQIKAPEALGRIAEALERSGRPVISEVRDEWKP
jgi:hypothetical protein